VLKHITTKQIVVDMLKINNILSLII